MPASTIRGRQGKCHQALRSRPQSSSLTTVEAERLLPGAPSLLRAAPVSHTDLKSGIVEGITTTPGIVEGITTTPGIVEGITATTVCGHPTIANRIVGGENAQPGEWPWQISLQRNGVHICGGSLITNQWVVSAASCFRLPLNSTIYRVHLGAFQLSIPGSTDVYTKVKNIILNSNFSFATGHAANIALLELQNPVNFTNNILPICLPESSIQIPTGKKCWVTGWGTISEGADLQFPQTLQEAEIPIFDQMTCNYLYMRGVNTSILDDMLCAGYEAGGTDSCQDDTGGPLVCQFGSTWLLAGIVNWGEGCALPQFPGVYTRTSFYVDWIKQYVPDIGLIVVSNITVPLINSTVSTPSTTTSNMQNSTGSVPQTQECGKPVIRNHAVGGQDAQKGEWPWQVSIRENGFHICGGTLITDGWVVTSVQCIQYKEPTSITVVLGTYQLSYWNPPQVSSGVRQVIKHPMYSGEIGSSGDIALLELQTRMNYTALILPVCLPAAPVKFPYGMHCWATGWRKSNSGGPINQQQTLQKVEVPLIDAHTCDTMYHINSFVSQNTPIIKDGMICAGSTKGADQSCQEYSGGPLVCQYDNTWLLAGIASYGDGCPQPNRPQVYTLVPAYTEWIMQNVPDISKNVLNVHITLSTVNPLPLPLDSGNSLTPFTAIIWIAFMLIIHLFSDV